MTQYDYRYMPYKWIKVLFQLYDHYNIVAFSKHVNNFTEI